MCQGTVERCVMHLSGGGNAKSGSSGLHNDVQSQQTCVPGCNGASNLSVPGTDVASNVHPLDATEHHLKNHPSLVQELTIIGSRTHHRVHATDSPAMGGDERRCRHLLSLS